MELTRQDIDTLLEAVEAWENRDATSGLMGDMIGAMLCRNDEDQRRMEAEREKRIRERETKQRVVKERSVLLRAKLIAMKDSMDAEALSNTGS